MYLNKNVGAGVTKTCKEFIDDNIYDSFKCYRDYNNTKLTRGGEICLSINSVLNPVDLVEINSTESRNLSVVDNVSIV